MSFPATGIFLAFLPHCVEQDCCCLSFGELGTLCRVAPGVGNEPSRCARAGHPFRCVGADLAIQLLRVDAEDIGGGAYAVGQSVCERGDGLLD
jgi:hypothetical protein